MRVLAIADRRPQIDIPSIIASEGIELVITLGDLAYQDIAALSGVNHIPKIGVYGNHDGGTYMSELGIWDMHTNVWSFQGLQFGGFEGCVRYKQNPSAIMYTQEEALELMKDFPKVDIFLSHCPPYGINDEEEIAHEGFKGLRTYLDIQQPKVWLHGHTYPTEETVIHFYENTRIEYVSGFKLLDLPRKML